MVDARLSRPARGFVRAEDRGRARLKLGDPVIVNVLGRNLTARVANLRTVDWQNSASIS